jgi:hypothetical protein
MAFFDQNDSLFMVKFGQFFTDLKFAPKIALFVRISLKKLPSTFKSRPTK